MSKQNFELYEFPQDRVKHVRRNNGTSDAEILEWDDDLLLSHPRFNPQYAGLNSPRVDVRVYVITPEGTPAIRLQM